MVTGRCLPFSPPAGAFTCIGHRMHHSAFPPHSHSHFSAFHARLIDLHRIRVVIWVSTVRPTRPSWHAGLEDAFRSRPTFWVTSSLDIVGDGLCSSEKVISKIYNEWHRGCQARSRYLPSKIQILVKKRGKKKEFQIFSLVLRLS